MVFLLMVNTTLYPFKMRLSVTPQLEFFLNVSKVMVVTVLVRDVNSMVNMLMGKLFFQIWIHV